MSTNGHATLDLRPREQRLTELYPWIPWCEPQPVTVANDAPWPTSVTRLTCRFCTAFYGLKAVQVEREQVTFADEEAHRRHLEREHAGAGNHRAALRRPLNHPPPPDPS